jgi:hypothetical protein
MEDPEGPDWKPGDGKPGDGWVSRRKQDRRKMTLMKNASSWRLLQGFLNGQSRPSCFLRACNFLEATEGTNYNGYNFAAYRSQEEGETWQPEHQDNLELRLTPKVVHGAKPDPSDEDIPF